MLDQLLAHVDLFLLLFVRTVGLIVAAPVWSQRAIPVQLRVALAAVVALVVFPLMPVTALPKTLTLMVPLAVKEVLVGLVIGFVASLALSAVQLAGQLLDMNMGLSMVAILDPLSHTSVPIMGSFLSMLQMLIFLSINGHHMLLRAVMDSYALVPLGQAKPSEQLSLTVLALAGHLFILGFKVAAPVLAALFFTTVALGVLNRAIPQMNVFAVGMSAQLAVGIFMVMVALPAYIAFLQAIFRSSFDDIWTALRLLKG